MATEADIRAGLKLTGDASGLEAAFNEAEQDTKHFTDTVERESAKATTSLKKLGQEFLLASAGSEKLAQGGNKLTQMALSLAGIGIGVASIRAYAAALIEAQINSDKLYNTLRFATGGGNPTREIEYLRDVTKELGLEFKASAQAYAKLAAASQGTALGMSQVRTIFEGVSRAATVMGLSAEETQGTLLAISQMMSKGTVQAEELRGQLGERLPGAFQIAARAMGVTTAELGKMLESGKVLSAEFLPKFAAELNKAFSGEAAKAAQSLQSDINRLSSEWDKLNKTIAQGGATDVAKGIIGYANRVLSETQAVIQQMNKEDLPKWFKLIGGAGAALASAIGVNVDPTQQALAYRAQLEERRKSLERVRQETAFPDRFDGSAQGSELAELKRKIAEWDAGANRGRLNLQSKDALRAAAAATLDKDDRDRHAALDGYTSTRKPSEAKQQAQAIAAENKAFELATRGWEKNSAEYRKAVEFHESTLAEIQKKHRDKDGEGEFKRAVEDQYRAGIATLEGLQKLEADDLKAHVAHLDSLAKQGLLSQRDVIEQKLAEQQASIDRQIGFAQAEAAIAQARGKGGDAERYREEIKALQAQRDGLRSAANDQQAELSAKQLAALNQWKQSEAEATEQIRFEITLIGKTAEEIERLTYARRVDAAVRAATRNADGTTKQDVNVGAYESAGKDDVAAHDQALAKKKAANDTYNADWKNGIKDGLQDYVKSAQTAAGAAQEALTNTFDKAGDALANYVTTGKFFFKDFARSVLADLAQIYAKQVIVWAVKQATGYANGGVIGDPAGASVNAANGAVFGPRGVRNFANGGVYDRPTYMQLANGGTALVGEAGEEAAMPLKRMRNGKLGVSAQGGGGQVVNQISVTVQTSGDDPKQHGEQISAAIVRRMEEIADKQIARNKEYGGMLA